MFGYLFLVVTGTVHTSCFVSDTFTASRKERKLDHVFLEEVLISQGTSPTVITNNLITSHHRMSFDPLPVHTQLADTNKSPHTGILKKKFFYIHEHAH